jgi:hypothetical protein
MHMAASKTEKRSLMFGVFVTWSGAKLLRFFGGGACDTPNVVSSGNFNDTLVGQKKNFDKLTKILLKNCTNFGMLVKNGMSENPTARQQFWENKY